MSGPKCDKSHCLLVLREEGGKLRNFDGDFLVGSSTRVALRGKGEDPLGGNTQRQISLGGNRFLALKKKKEI